MMCKIWNIDASVKIEKPDTKAARGWMRIQNRPPTDKSVKSYEMKQVKKRKVMNGRRRVSCLR